MIDYREIPSDLREPYSAFLRDLAELLHGQGRTLTVVLPFPADTANTGTYDWLAIGRAADEVVVTGPLDPLAYVPDGPVDQMLGWAATQVSRGNSGAGAGRAQRGRPGRRRFRAGRVQRRVELPGRRGARCVRAGRTWPGGHGAIERRARGIWQRRTAQTAYVRYLDADGNPLRTMWMTGQDALYFRMQRATAHQLGGVMVRNLMSPDVVPGLDTALLAYRLDQPLVAAPIPASSGWRSTAIRRGAGSYDRRAVRVPGG